MKEETALTSKEYELQGKEFTLPLPTKHSLKVKTIQAHCTAKDMNLQSKRWFGCGNCPWRGTSLCDYGFKRGKGHPVKGAAELDLGVICAKRKYYVLSLYSGKECNIARHKSLIRDYNQYILHSTFMDDLNKIQVYDEQILALEDQLIDNPSDIDVLNKVKSIHNMRTSLQDKMIDLGLNLRKLEEKELDRESKDNNMDKLTQKLGIGEVNRIIAGDFQPSKEHVIEADFEDIIEDE